MQAWSSDFFYEFGDIASYKNLFYFCLAKKTRSHPTDASDWVSIDLFCEELPSAAKCGTVVFVESTGQCFIFCDKWTELSKRRRSKIVFSNRNPKSEDSGRLWVNESEGLIFKNSEGWHMVNSSEDEIFEFPFAPTPLDDEADSAGNGVVTLGAFWVDYKNDKIYVNEDPSYKKSIWRKI